MAQNLYIEAKQRGLRLEIRGDKLAVIPATSCPPDFATLLRKHKRELLDWLEARNAGLDSDELPWLHIAKQILAGEFEGLLDRSVRKSLEIGLRSISHPLSQRALQQLTHNVKSK